jgi:hypothetical protein
VKKFNGILLLVLILLIAGCKVDYDITIKSDLSGKCVAKILTFGLVSKDKIQENLKAKGVKKYSITEYTDNVEMGNGVVMPMQGLQLTTTWDDPAEMGSMLRKNADGTVSVSMDYMASAGGRAVVRVEGKIDPDSTKGRLTGPDTVEFDSGKKISFRFTPESRMSQKLLIIATIAGLLFIAGIIIFAIRKKSSPVASHSAPTAAVGDIVPPQVKTFCTECGVEAGPEDRFCSKCGNKLV